MPKKTATTKTAKRTTSASKSKAASKSRKSSTRATAKKTSAKETVEAGDQEVTIDRRRGDQSAGDTPKVERRKKVQRRRQIDPTTCERDYTEHEVEFMNALDEYKRTSGRMFPTCSEVLEVIRGLGYVRLSPAELAARTAEEAPAEIVEDQDVPASEELELAGSVESEF